MRRTPFLHRHRPRLAVVLARRSGRFSLAVTALIAVAAAAGPSPAHGRPSTSSWSFWRMHQPDSPFRDPQWMERLNGTDPCGRYGTRNAMEAYALFKTPETDADMEPTRLGRKLMLAWPLIGRGNLLPLMLEPSGSLAAAVVVRTALGGGGRSARIECPPGFVAIDTHVHTCYSPDSVADPARVLLAAARRGLAGIAVTDHNTVDGAVHAQVIAQRLKERGKLPADFVVIEGEEVGSREGHIIGLFLNATVPPDLSAEATIAAIHAQGGLAVAAHPLLPSGVGREAGTLPFDAVETENMAESLHFALASGRANRMRAPFYAGLGKPALGVSDAHDPSVVGMGYTLIPGPGLEEADLRQALLAGQTEACVLDNSRPVRRLRRLASRLPHPASGFRALQRVFGTGGRLLKSLTRADRARFGPRFSHGGLGWSLSLTKGF